MSVDAKALVEAEAVCAGYANGPDAVAGVDLRASAGRILVLTGPNGAGKSTLLAVLAGILAPRRGRVTIDGRDVCSLPGPERARLMGYLPQEVRASAPFTVREVVALGRFPHGRGLAFETDDDLCAVDEALAATGMTALAGRPFGELSGGEKQRVLIASILAQGPRVLLLDEPTSALDLGRKAEVFAILRERARKGAAVVVVTHDLNLAGVFADEVALLAKGVILVLGPPAQVLRREVLEPAYGPAFVVVPRADSAVPAVLPRPVEAAR
ncbi:MAG: ABC transporter ATP-binding protein [Deltaproteobacteria bacterium]|nr:ABC transporter ATP-binding protein [Deltaproteobacteria bacterium]